MFRSTPYISLLFALQLTACPADPDDSNRLGNDNGAEADGDAAGGPDRDDEGGAGDDQLPADDELPDDGAAGTEDDTATEGPGGDGENGGADDGTIDPDPQQLELCALFHEGWGYEVATYYEPGEEPIVVSVWGEANFRADGTYEQNYYIGDIGNFYSGTYIIEGDRLTTYDEAGEVVFEYRFTCGDELRELVLTLENEDGTPSIIFGLTSLAQ